MPNPASKPLIEKSETQVWTTETLHLNEKFESRLKMMPLAHKLKHITKRPSLGTPPKDSRTSGRFRIKWSSVVFSGTANGFQVCKKGVERQMRRSAMQWASCEVDMATCPAHLSLAMASHWPESRLFLGTINNVQFYAFVRRVFLQPCLGRKNLVCSFLELERDVFIEHDEFRTML